MEAHTGQQSFESYAKEKHQRIMEALANAATWNELHTALAGMGMELKPHGNGLVIKDRHSKAALKASAVDRSLSMKKLEARFGAYENPGKDLPQQEWYEARPMQRGPERGALYADYKALLAERIRRLDKIKTREEADTARIREKWAQERRNLVNKFLPQRSSRKLAASARHFEREDREKSRARFRKEREVVKADIPFAFWTDFLRQRAAEGNETALAILRSKKEEVAPETPSERDRSAGLAARRSEIRQDFLAREGEVMIAAGLSDKSRRGLLAILKMERLAAEEAAGSLRRKGVSPRQALFQGIRHHIDGKGTVIFTLPGGDSIRDTGKQVFFSVGSAEARAVAELYASQKWGKKVRLEDNHIVFDPPKKKQMDLGR